MAQSITLQTNDSIVSSGDALGQLQFAASAESDGGASRYVVGQIYAMSEGSFSAVSNPAGIVFSTSEANALPASGRIMVSAQGDLIPLANNAYQIGHANATFSEAHIGTVNASSFVKNGGTSSQFLKADGSVDSTDYGQGSTYVSGVAVYASGQSEINQDGIEYVSGVAMFGLILANSGVKGVGTANQLTYWDGVNTIGSLSTSTYPNLTETSYVKGVTSAIQTQINAKTSCTGTVTNVSAGNGLDFSSITTTGSVTLGTPGSTTLSSTNAVTTTSHTHAFVPGGSTSQYIRGDGSLETFPTIASDIYKFEGTGSIIPASGSNTGGSWSVVSGGCSNTASGYSSTVGGGCCNCATGNFATISGGCCNKAIGCKSTVGGGGSRNTLGSNAGNWAVGDGSTVSGGYGNTACAYASTVGGGWYNYVYDCYTVISGGSFNSACGCYSTVSGGRSNRTQDCYSNVAGGFNNHASGNFSSISGGYRNFVTGQSSTVSGGYCNNLYGNCSVVTGGQINIASGDFSSVGGGYNNCAMCSYSAVVGGLLNVASGDYSAVVAGSGNVASGACSFVGGGSNNQAFCVASSLVGGIQNKSCGYASFLGAGTYNCVNGTGSTVSAGYCNYTNGAFSSIGAGIFNCATAYGAGIVAGSYNKATACYAGVVAGRSNCAGAECSLIGAGQCNTIQASGTYGFIGGGCSNLICGDKSCYAVIGGGINNLVAHCYSTVGGGNTNCATGPISVVAGGQSNRSTGFYSVISGGSDNCSVGSWSTLSGGRLNCATNSYSFVGGGRQNTASNTYASVVGGCNNNVYCCYGFIGGGTLNVASGDYGAVVAGSGNIASGACSFIGGGFNNSATNNRSVVSGGSNNIASAIASTISGGLSNSAVGTGSVVAGGSSNCANNSYSTVGGGYLNCAAGACSTVSGGQNNLATGDWGVVGGGWSNNNCGGCSVIAGGRSNRIVASLSFIGAGYNNLSNGGSYNVIGGGLSNSAPSSYNFIGGGRSNSINGVNNNRNYNSISGGYLNCVDIGTYNSIHGGYCNCIGGYSSSIIGGALNTIQNSIVYGIAGGRENNVYCDYGIALGGTLNVASGDYSAVVAGSGNIASGVSSFIGGGIDNTACGTYSTVGGGCSNVANGNGSTIGGGGRNTVCQQSSTIAGGVFNCALGQCSTVGGGVSNRALGQGTTISGGAANQAHAAFAAVVGGSANYVSGAYSFVGGGNGHFVSGDYSSILGGASNNDGGCNNAHLIGSNLTATQANTTFVENLHATGVIKASTLIKNGGTSSQFLKADGSVDDTDYSGNNTYVSGIATYASGQSIINADGVEYVSGMVISASGVSGTGAANYISKWSNSTKLTNSVIYDNGTNIGIGTASPNYTLDVAGSGTFSNDLVIGGNLTVNGTTVTANVDTMEVEDPIVTLGIASGNIITDTTFDRGLALVRSESETAFMGWDVSESEFSFLSSGVPQNSSGNYVPGTYGNVQMGGLTATTANFSSTIDAASIGTGEDNSVVILDSDGKLRTDEIDSRVWGSSLVDGGGTANQITYWTDPNTISALSTATYPSLTELSYVKGVTSAIQTQINAKTSCTGTVTSVGITAGNLIDVTGSPVTTAGSITVNVDLSELATSTTNGDGDYFVVVDTANAQRKLTKANIALSGFNNDSGWTSCVGTVTSVSAGNGLSFSTITSAGSVTLGTPSSVTLGSSNSVSAGTHSHAFAPGGTTAQYIRGDGTLATFPTNLATDTELDYVSGVATYASGQAIENETAIATKQDTITGAATTITSSNLTANRAVISNGSGKVAVSPVTSTELSYLDGTTSNVQTQINAKTSCTGTVTSVGITAGSLIDVTGGPITTNGNITVNVDLSELTTSTTDGDGDFFAVVDSSNVQRKLTKGNINISGFNNNSGFTTCSGTVTSVAAGNGMNFTTVTGAGSVVLGTPGSTTLVSTNSVTATSHTHAFAPGGSTAQYIRGDGTLATLPTYTVNNGTLTMNVSGTGLSGSSSFTANQAGNSTFTVTSNATSSNTASTIVSRDSSGNFNAGTVTVTQLNSDNITINGNTISSTNTNGDINLNANGTGNVVVAGHFSASTKSFLIDHPTKEGKKLQYGSLESPYHGVRLTGKGTVNNGKFIVELPEYISELVNEEDISIQVTNHNHSVILYVSDIDVQNNRFTVKTNSWFKRNGLEFFWSFTAIRKDVEPLVVEY